MTHDHHHDHEHHHHDHNHHHHHDHNGHDHIVLTVEIWQHEIQEFIRADLAKLYKLAYESYLQQGRGFIYVQTTAQEDGVVQYEVSFQGYQGVVDLMDQSPDLKQRVYEYDPKVDFVLFAVDPSLDVHQVMTIHTQRKN